MFFKKVFVEVAHVCFDTVVAIVLVGYAKTLYIYIYIYIYTQVHLNELECCGKVHLFQ